MDAKKLDDDVTELTTPFLDRHNDNLQIYAERTGDDLYLLSDDGYIVTELKSSGVEPYGSRRSEMVRELLSGHGVVLDRGELVVEASASELGQRAHSLVQAMLSLDDMFVLAQPRVATVFWEDVNRFLDDQDVRYSPHVKFAGKSGLDHLIDFLVPKSKKAPERIVQVVNNPRRDRIDSLLFTATDIRSARSHEVSYYAVLNDNRKKVPPEVISALQAYDITPEPWSDRERLIGELVA
ncbi:DUF1829 domain-containing protein [Actinomadura nitritigenes]|uniref:DUF1829 domain-containing protein n=1 Tax=Actinomadura nitritigenes TaxID=134602 RepID=UPI003D8B1095